MPILARFCTSWCSGVPHSMAKSASKNDLSADPSPLSNVSQENAWKAVELTIGNTRKLSKSNFGSASRPPANRDFLASFSPVFILMVKAYTIEPTRIKTARAIGKMSVKNMRSQKVPSPMHESGRDSPPMFTLKTSKIESTLCACTGEWGAGFA